MSDPLAQFRKKPPTQSGPPPRSAEVKAAYVAFDGKDKLDRLRIRRANAATRSPGYAYLLDVVYDGEFGTEIVLVYTYMMVLIRGRNLQTLVIALEISTADFIQEFDSDRWEMPADKSAAFVESIEVVVKAGDEAVTTSEKRK